MKADNNMILREIAGEYLLIPTGETALRIHGMITMTESGVLLWKRLQTEATEEELVDTILSEYEIDRETAKADVAEFLQKMLTLGIVA